MATAVTHYTSYKARPFTREQRDSTTILFGGLTWIVVQPVTDPKGAGSYVGVSLQMLPEVQQHFGALHVALDCVAHDLLADEILSSRRFFSTRFGISAELVLKILHGFSQ